MKSLRRWSLDDTFYNIVEIFYKIFSIFFPNTDDRTFTFIGSRFTRIVTLMISEIEKFLDKDTLWQLYISDKLKSIVAFYAFKISFYSDYFTMNYDDSFIILIESKQFAWWSDYSQSLTPYPWSYFLDIFLCFMVISDNVYSIMFFYERSCQKNGRSRMENTGVDHNWGL